MWIVSCCAHVPLSKLFHLKKSNEVHVASGVKADKRKVYKESFH